MGEWYLRTFKYPTGLNKLKISELDFNIPSARLSKLSMQQYVALSEHKLRKSIIRVNLLTSIMSISYFCKKFILIFLSAKYRLRFCGNSFSFLSAI